MRKITFNQGDLQKLLETTVARLAKQKGIPNSITLETNPSIKLSEDERVSVIFENDAYEKMRALVRVATKEIGWYGTVERISEKEFVVKDIFVGPQIVTSVTVDTDDEEFVKWCDSLSDETFNTMRFYGHSHVNMGVTPSGTDNTFQNNQIQNVKDFYIFCILNKQNSAWFNIYDIENNILYENDDINYKYYVNPQEEWAKEQIKKQVKERTFVANMGDKKINNMPKDAYDPEWWRRKNWHQDWDY